MAISVKRTSSLTQGGVKLLCYGQAGAGVSIEPGPIGSGESMP